MPSVRFHIPQGTLDMLVLQIQSLEPARGFGIAQRPQQISRQAVQVNQGSMYPALHRLEQKGWLKAEWRPSTGIGCDHGSLRRGVYNKQRHFVITRRMVLVPLVAGHRLGAQRPRAITLDQALLNQLFSELPNDERRDLKGVRIVVDGELRAEAYFNGGGPEVLHDIRSAGKSVTSLLVGIAIDKRLVRNVRVPFVRLLRVTGQADKAGITLEDLLTMRSGLAANDDDPSSPGNENRLDASPSWLDFALAVPVKEPPGRTYQYCSLNAFLAGAAIEDACGQPLDDLAREHLFTQLGIEHFEWRRGPKDRVAGQGNLRLTLAAMTKIGQMCLDQGRVGQRQILSKRWISRSLAAIVPIARVDPYADFYGYMWYTKSDQLGDQKIRVHFASGNGGNKIYLVPHFRMVVGITSAAYGRGYGQRRSQDILRRVLSAVRV